MTTNLSPTESDRNEKRKTQFTKLSLRPVEKKKMIVALPLNRWKLNMYDWKTFCHITNTTHVDSLLRFLISYFDSRSVPYFTYSHQKVVSIRKKRNQQKKQLSQLSKTLNDIVIGSNTNVGVIENETLESQTDGRYNNTERTVDG